VTSNPLSKVDPNGLDGIFVNYMGYQAAITSNVSLPVGHAGVIAIDPSNGETSYYDFGRYGGKYGDIRDPYDVGAVIFDKNGNPTPESIEEVVTNASNSYGKGYPPYYEYSRKPYKDIVDYANNRREQARNGTRPYNFVFDNCKNFGREAASPGLGSLPR
jgi:hypothetical protein